MTNPVCTDAAEAAELAALRRENAILRETLDAIDGAVVMYDAQRRYVLGNRAYHELFPHLPPDRELVGRPFAEMLALSIAAGNITDPRALTDTEAFIAQRVHEMDQQEIAPREAFGLSQRRWYMIRSKITPSGSHVSLRVDIDEQKRLQEQLEAAGDEAEAASRAKSLLLANIERELRAPLNAVMSFTQLMEEQAHGPLGVPHGVAEYVEYAQSIREGGTHLLSLIADLVDFAQAEAGRRTLTDELVDLRAMMLAVCRLLQPEAVEAGVRLSTEVPDDLPTVRADATRLRQILFNLLNNAIKFSEPDDTVCLRAALVADQGMLISVIDTGPGISAEDLPRVLQPFERAIDRAGREVPGIGLGLPLVSHLVALHGGKFTLESTPGIGTTASFLMPTERVLAPPMRKA